MTTHDVLYPYDPERPRASEALGMVQPLDIPAYLKARQAYEASETETAYDLYMQARERRLARWQAFMDGLLHPAVIVALAAVGIFVIVGLTVYLAHQPVDACHPPEGGVASMACPEASDGD